MAERISRRKVLQAAGAAGAGSAAAVAFLFNRPRPVKGSFVDNGGAVGHMIRDGQGYEAGTERESVPVVIVGGGIAGLSAGWWMRRLGFDEFVLLEMEEAAGGNSRSGENAITKYPWGAHYVPLPERRIPLVEALFTDLGVLRDGRWDPAHVSRSPLSRLHVGGEWQPGIEPGLVSESNAADQFDRFWDRIDYFRQGGEFTIPISQPTITAGLDRISMKTWMVEEGFYHEHLRWYVDYACRDDYGCGYDQASAWAGIHYFAARPEDDEGYLTWPEGNGWVVKRLKQKLGERVRTGAPVRRISEVGRRLEVVTEGRTYDCEAVVFAAPTFLVPYVMPQLAGSLPAPSDFVYSPWYTANLVIDELPRDNGASLSWENIIYDSPGLGYVPATHQSGDASRAPAVWTYYRALARQDPRAARTALLHESWEERKEGILLDLEKAHPDIRQCVSRIDIMRMGHAMIRPGLGMIGSAARRELADLRGPVQLANSDLSAVSIFEEAQYRGVRAAERVLERLGFRHLEHAA